MLMLPTLRMKALIARLIGYIPYAYLLRVPLTLALALLALPLLARTVAGSVLGNLFVLSPGELFWVSLAAVLAAATVLVTARVVLLYGADRFAVAGFRATQRLLLLPVLATVGIALWVVGFALCASILETPAPSHLALWVGAGVGTITGMVLVWLLEVLRFRFAEPPPLAKEPTGKPSAPESSAPDPFGPEPSLPESSARESSVPQSSAPEPSAPDLAVPAALVPSAVHRKKRPDLAKSLARGIGKRLGRAPGYVDPRTGELLAAHVYALLVLATLLVLYFVGFFADSPTRDGGSRAPALVYLLLLLVVVTWMLAGAAFFLDRYRIPVLLLPVLLLALSFFWPTDHFFATHPLPAVSSPPTVAAAAPAAAQPERALAGLPDCRLTAVAASGGGIRAAGWAAQVLTGLHRQSAAFSPSLRFLSTVSGGSVGAMYFVGAFAPGPSAKPSPGQPPKPSPGPPADKLDGIVELAMRSSLKDVAWGFAYPDLWRVVTPVVLSSATDRAWALEQAWSRGWSSRDDRISTWRRDAIARRKPALAFNATIVETGQRLVVGTFDPGRMRTLTFDQVYPGRDVSVLTAVRLSATFTYVTPVARARDPHATKWHLADGGYQDNFGVATLVDWLEAAVLGADATDAEGKPCGERLRIAIVLIGAHEGLAKAKNRSWAFQVGAPLNVLLAIRTAGPKERNRVEVELLRQGLGARLGVACFDYQAKDSPLSWHLSERQRQEIRGAWNTKPIQDRVRDLDAFLARGSPIPGSCP